MENKILNGLIIAAAGAITMKAFRAVKKYKADMEEHEEIIEDSEND